MLVCFSLQVELELAEKLAMTPDEVSLATPPLARVLAKQKFKPALRKAIVSSGDYVTLTVVFGGYALRIAEVVKEINHARRGGISQQVQNAPRGIQNGNRPDEGPDFSWVGAQYRPN